MATNEKLKAGRLAIAFTGPSGIGKTTLAKFVSEQLGIPFVSSSMTDLIPETKEVHQSQMIQEYSLERESKLIQARYGVIEANPQMVTDRSYMDSLAYFLLKGQSQLDPLECAKFISICKERLLRDISHLILMPLSYHQARMSTIEDNGKRITNPYFQWLVSSTTISSTIDLLDTPEISFMKEESTDAWVIRDVITGNTLKLLMLDSYGLEERKQRIIKFLN